MHKEFHPYTKYLTYTDPGCIPPHWSVTEYKIYQGHPIFELRNELPLAGALSEILKNRESARAFTKNGQLTFEALSNILSYGAGELSVMLPHTTERRRRTYPSAGARYPCEAYLLITQNVSVLTPGVYHFRPDSNALELLTDSFEETGTYILDDKLKDAQVYIFITALLDRSIDKYGERGYRFCHLEAGAIAQNMSLLATSLGCTSTWIGGTDDQAIETLLDIDGVGEVLLITIGLS